ncbi:Fic family protein [Persicobacter sp. CCB-QB2]|uniref:Fic family protein n=1 Tax=Persicobacter sp. CCB-QB2 TaxID=1561025 RepID=UPI0006A9D6B9|nr:Fic family protein [Persicobacter sp. CCB-QB2]
MGLLISGRWINFFFALEVIYYPDFFDKAAYLLFAINSNHPFQDGNKRISIVSFTYFALINNVPNELVDEFTGKWAEELALDLASGKYQMEALIEFLKDKLGHWRA